MPSCDAELPGPAGAKGGRDLGRRAHARGPRLARSLGFRRATMSSASRSSVTSGSTRCSSDCGARAARSSRRSPAIRGRSPRASSQAAPSDTSRTCKPSPTHVLHSRAREPSAVRFSSPARSISWRISTRERKTAEKIESWRTAERLRVRGRRRPDDRRARVCRRLHRRPTSPITGGRKRRMVLSSRRFLRRSERLFRVGQLAGRAEPRDLPRRRLLARGRLLGVQGREAADRGPWLVGAATVLGLIPPFIGALIYMLFRPPEYLEDVRERELEIKAMEESLGRGRRSTARSAAPTSRELPRLPRVHDSAATGVHELQGAARAALASLPVLRDADRVAGADPLPPARTPRRETGSE